MVFLRRRWLDSILFSMKSFRHRDFLRILRFERHGPLTSRFSVLSNVDLGMDNGYSMALMVSVHTSDFLAEDNETIPLKQSRLTSLN
jgi:hypothetical protein